MFEAIMNQELKKLVEFGADIEFSCKGKMYTILPWVEVGIVIGEQGEDDYIYQTYEEMVINFIIGGKPMKEVMDDIVIEFTSGCK